MIGPCIALRGVRKRYPMGGESVLALDGVDLDVAPHDYVAVTGPSGSGKSTVMSILACLDTPSSGSYLLNGRDIARLDAGELATIRNREIGLVFQNFNLLPRASALENVMLPLVYRGVRHGERSRRALAVLEQVGLAHRADHLPSQLSRGQRQRVAIARALCSEPSVLLADEPTGNLDSASAAAVMALFDDLHAQGHTVVVVTHEAEIARRCRRIVTLRDGRIVGDVLAAAAPPPCPAAQPEQADVHPR
ncbi:putative ABC transport system ATP-binding protein [Pseudoduganella flava]|uniref:ATP-binding cassette domain-containing protein n=1 Tax=Pseudoduganella flava TaxID=871742 RepID=A0A562Q155_9BURK|nr:ABC transporter ATP-binding protein [Pseudoduganella flava]QGZ38077.1 ATP-binding cassette domain-containing protein [Pseudoduganella flava]TWI50412.1 putative ABC transport system ATP-binding protein [Pseudoduganella flava]